MKANLLQGLSIVDSQMIIMPMGAKVKVIFEGFAHDMCHFCVGLYL